MALVYQLSEKLAEIGTDMNGTKILALVSWNGAPPKLELRNWYTDANEKQKPGKGITLTIEEAVELFKALNKYLDSCEN